MRLKTGSIEAFEKRFIPEPNTGCWLWLAGVNPSNGYGRFYGPARKLLYAHKFSYTFYKGPIPRGLILRHTCDVKICVNPDHIILGTHLDNARDAVQRGLYSKGETHGCVKLDVTTVLAIREAKGSTLEVARRFNISRMHVDRIRQRRSWKHLP